MNPFSTGRACQAKSRRASRSRELTLVHSEIAREHGTEFPAPVHVLGLVDGYLAVVVLDAICLGLVVQLLKCGLVGLSLHSVAMLGRSLQHAIGASDVEGEEEPHIGSTRVGCHFCC